MDRLDAFAGWIAARSGDDHRDLPDIPSSGYGTTDQGHAGGCG